MDDENRLVSIFPMLGESGLAVEELDLNVTARNCLMRGGIGTVGQLLQLTHLELLALFPNRKLPFYSEIISRLTSLAQPPKPAKRSDTYPVSSLRDALPGCGASGKKFNVFQVAGIWKSEEIHTRIIAELLNPSSSFHENGAVFLKKFADAIHLPIPPEELPGAAVETEVHTNEDGRSGRDRRIDMVISTQSCYLPFEVKIWAGDQESQLYDYYQFAARQRKEPPPFIYYLTPDGHAPSPHSLRSSTGQESQVKVCLLSFQAHVLPWLEDCMKDKDVFIPSEVLEIMEQLHDNIARSFTVEEDILDAAEQDLSEYQLEWTECTAEYRTFTLETFENRTVALRIKRYYGGNQKVKLSVIFGHTEDTDDGPQMNYAGALGPEDAKPLLERTFASKEYLNLDQKKGWDWLKKCIISKTEFQTAFQERIFNCLQPEVQNRLLWGKTEDFNESGKQENNSNGL